MTSPLEGMLVLDMTRNLAGPFCTMILGDLGARVIKVERPGVGDDTREWLPPSWGDSSSLFLAINRNKESITVDIEAPEGAEVIRRLAARADIIVESFRGGSLAKKGFGFEDVRKLNPRTVYCSLSAFGGRGPGRDRPGYDALIQACSGIMSITGEPGRTAVRAGPSIIDMGSAHWAAMGILAALRLRDETGEAQLVETSLFETGVNWMSYFAAGYIADGSIAGRVGSQHSSMAPYEDFATRDGVIYLAAPNQALFVTLCKVLGVPEASNNPLFKDNFSRLANRDALHALIEGRLKTDDRVAWEGRLVKAGIPFARLQTIDEVVNDPQVEALGLIRNFNHPDIPDYRLVDHPVSYNGTRSFRADPAPDLGQHTEAILRSLGFHEHEYPALFDKKAGEA